MFRYITKVFHPWIIIVLMLLTSCLPTQTSVPTLLHSTTAIPSYTPTSTSTVVWFPATPTRTPFPTSTPLPPTPELRPGLGVMILYDEFNTADAWTLSDSAKGSVALGKNKLTIAIASQKTYLSSIRSQPLFGNFYAEITASPNLCRGTDEYGLLIRVNSAQDFYRFSITCDGHTRLDRVYHGEASSPQPFIMGIKVPVGSPSSSSLGVWALNNEMRFFINDAYQFTVRDPLLSSGAIGIFARSTGETAVTVNFSNLMVYEVIVK